MHSANWNCLILIVAAMIGFSLSGFGSAIAVNNARALVEESRTTIDFSPEAVFFLSNSSVAFVDSAQSRTTIWDLEGGAVRNLSAAQGIGGIIAVADSKMTCAAHSPRGEVAVWQTEPGQHLADLCVLRDTPHPCAAFSPNGQLLAITDLRDEIQLWDLETGDLVHTLVEHDSNIFEIAFSADGAMLATAGGWSGSATDADSCIIIWDVDSGQHVARLSTIDIGDNHAIAFAGNGTRLISGGVERLIVWDTSSWERVYDSGSSYVGSAGIDVSPNQEVLALAYWGETIRLVNLDSMRTLWDLPAAGTPLDVAFSPDGSRLVAAFQNGVVVVWTTP